MNDAQVPTVCEYSDLKSATLRSVRGWRLGMIALVSAFVCVSLWGRPGHTSPNSFGRGTIHRGTAPTVADGTGNFPDALPRYHLAEQLICSDCHVLHASQSHPYDPPQPGLEVPYAGTTNPKLLTEPDPLDLCLNCHDGQTFAPDVVTTDANGLTQRSAGHFDEAEVISPRGHDLGRNLPNICLRCHFGAPGNEKITCIDCHNPHGNNVARNLQWASDPPGTPDLGLFVNPAATDMARYEEANVSFGTLDTGALREVTNMCIDCHHTLTGPTYTDPDGDGIHSRHPSYDSERGQPNSIDQGAGDGGSAPAHWDGGTGSGFTVPRVRFVVSQASDYASALTVDASTNGVFCLSCHRAHGSNQAFGVTWQLEPNGYSAPGCDQCHLIADVAP